MEFICDAFGRIDDKFIDEVTDAKIQPIQKKLVLIKWQKIAVLAACIVFVISTFLIAPNILKYNQLTQSPECMTSTDSESKTPDNNAAMNPVGETTTSGSETATSQGNEMNKTTKKETTPTSIRTTTPSIVKNTNLPKEPSVSTITRDGIPFTVVINGTGKSSGSDLSENTALHWLGTLECYQNQQVSSLQIIRGHKVNATSYYGEVPAKDGTTKVISFSVAEIYIDEVLKENNSSGYEVGDIVKIYEDYAFKSYNLYSDNTVNGNKPLDNGEYVFLLSYNPNAVFDGLTQPKEYFQNELTGVWQYIASCTPEFYTEKNAALMEYHKNYGNVIK